MSNTIALCGERNRPLLKLVAMKDELQSEVSQIFLDQEREFNRNCIVRDFNQDWRLDPNEIATVPIPDGVEVFERILNVSPTNMDPLETSDIVRGRVRALAAVAPSENPQRILIQWFDRSQVLHPGRFLFLERGTFKRMDSASMRLGDNLTCVIEDGHIQFKNVNKLARFMDISGIMREATAEEVTEFIDNDLFEVSDSQQFRANANSLTRRRIRSIKDRGLLTNQNANALQTLADEAGVNFEIHDGKIVMPSRNTEITKLVHFLNDGRYLGPVSKEPMMANSYRPAND